MDEQLAMKLPEEAGAPRRRPSGHTPMPTSAIGRRPSWREQRDSSTGCAFCLWTAERTQTPNLQIRSWDAPLLMAGIRVFHRAP
jgi:hypothetical protein